MARTREHIWRAFEAFHAKNPAVYCRMNELAHEAKHRGERGNIALLAERVRAWLPCTEGDAYKINNTYRACYARLLMAREPELRGFFEIRAEPHDPEYHQRMQRVLHTMAAESEPKPEPGRLF